jgi:hypothetical protein
MRTETKSGQGFMAGTSSPYLGSHHMMHDYITGGFTANTSLAEYCRSHGYALGRTGDMISDSAISFQPIFAQWIQHFHVNTFQQVLGAPGWTHTVYGIDQVGFIPIPLGTADTLIHHIHAFTIHVTALILLKGVLFARGSRLIADKALLGFRFP